MITLTENAINQIKIIAETSDKKILRFGVVSGGCSGFAYGMEMIDESEILEDDQIIDNDEIKVVVDGMSAPYIYGTEIDWINEIMGSHFVFNNPMEANGCGCGTSFSV